MVRRAMTPANHALRQVRRGAACRPLPTKLCACVDRHAWRRGLSCPFRLFQKEFFMFVKKLLVTLMVAAGTAGAVAVPLSIAVAATVYVQTAPPPPRAERVPSPRRGYVWAPGYWNWSGKRHVWVGGHWERERRGYAYRPHQWVEHDGRWSLERGRWDRDGDGIPNNRDAHPDNPRRP